VNAIRKSYEYSLYVVVLLVCCALFACSGPTPDTDLGQPDTSPADNGDPSDCEGPTIDDFAVGVLAGDTFDAWADGQEIPFSSPGQSSPYTSVDLFVKGGSGVATTVKVTVTNSSTSETYSETTYTDVSFTCVDGVGFVLKNFSIEYYVDDVFELDGDGVDLEVDAVFLNSEGNTINVSTMVVGSLFFEP